MKTTRQRITESEKHFPKYNSHSTGTDSFHLLPSIGQAPGQALVATSGTMEMFNELECYRVGDIIASYMPKVRNEFMKNDEQSFFVVRISKTPNDSSCLFSIDDGNEDDEGILVTQEIPYTDLPVNVKMYLQWGSISETNTGWVLMQTSEY